MPLIADKFAEAFRSPASKESLLALLKAHRPDLYSEAKDLVENEAAWERFLREKYVPILSGSLAKSTQNLPEKRLALTKMRALLNSGTTTESSMKELFQKHPWLLGLQYSGIAREKRAGESLVVDYLMQRIDGGHDVLELKGPSASIMDRRSPTSPRQTREFWGSLFQLMRYLDYYDRHVDYVQSQEGKAVYKPTGILVIGRTRESERDDVNLLNSHLARIRVLTYDDVLHAAENALNTLTSPGLRRR